MKERDSSVLGNERRPYQLYAATEVLLVFLIAAGLYLPFLSQQFDLNGIAEADAVDSGNLFSANHLLYRPLGLFAGHLAGVVGFAGRSIVILQVLSALSGAASIALAYSFFRALACGRFAAAIAAFWLATTWAHWSFSTDAMYIPVAALFIAAAATALLQPGRLFAILCGILVGFAVTTWEANVLLIPLFMAGLFVFRTGARQDRLRLVGHFVWASLIPIAGIYVVAALGAGINTPRGLLTWITTHGNGVVLPMWGELDWSRIGPGAQTALNSIVFLPLATRSWQFAGALGFPVVLIIWALLARISVEWRVTAWLVGGYVVFIPFVVWWDPWEAKWFFVANVFLAALFAQLLQGLAARLSAQSTRAAKVSVMVLMAFSGAANFPVIRDRHSARNTNLEMSRCVASHMQPNDIFISTDWSWAGYLGYFFHRKDVSVIDWSATLGNRAATLGMIGEKILEAQVSHGNAYIVDMASYPKDHVAWLESQTHLRNEDLAAYQGEMAFKCEGVGIRRVPLIEVTDANGERTGDYSDRFKLSVSSTEVAVGEKYKLTISNVSFKRVLVRYRLNDGPVKVFVADLGAEGSVEYDINPTTQKGLYEFVSFLIPGHIAWIMTDQSIRVR